jgi:hypothetical protein
MVKGQIAGNKGGPTVRVRPVIHTMSNHKRKRPKNRRAGCLMCKPWKVNGQNKDSKSNAKACDFRRKEAMDPKSELS